MNLMILITILINDEASENENISTSTEESLYVNPKDSFSDTVQNFFLSEISDINAEIKNNCNQETSKEISAGIDEKIEPL